MSILHVFTEEPSAMNVFNVLLPNLLPENTAFRVYPHQGKKDLENALKKTLPSISNIPGSKILITRDQDSEDCIKVKNQIKEIIKDKCKCEYFIRIVCKELESWFLGDLQAIQAAYPRFKPEHYGVKANFRNVDKIINPNKLLLRMIPEFTKKETLPKLEVSETIASFLDFDNNTSSSFNITISAIKKLSQNFQ